MNNSRSLIAEFIGTFWLVLGGCGAAVMAGETISWVGVSFAFGLCVLGMAYAVGPISGGHFNPAVTIGLWMAGRFEGSRITGYLLAQVLGAIAGAGMLYTIASGTGALDVGKGLASNGFGDLSPGNYSMLACLICEVVATFLFVLIILGSTDGSSSPAMAGIAIGLTLVCIHLVTIPVTNTSVNPVRSTGPAMIVGLLSDNGEYVRQLWLFWLAPLLGGGLAGMAYRSLLAEKK